MNIMLIAAVMFLVGCASSRPSELNNRRSTSDYNRDVAECEREAALSAAGSKAQAFDSCMKARNHTPKR
jgi:hypothetical protein